jgi:hypothetical protein
MFALRVLASARPLVVRAGPQFIYTPRLSFSSTTSIFALTPILLARPPIAKKPATPTPTPKPTPVEEDDESVLAATTANSDDPLDVEYRKFVERHHAAQLQQQRQREKKLQQQQQTSSQQQSQSYQGRFQHGGRGGNTRMANANSVIRVTDDSGGNMQVFPTLDEAHAAARTGGFLLRQTSEFPPSYMFIKRPDILRNDQITHPVLTVISETGENLGQLRIDEALRRATSANLDLILVGENPPAARITDFGKYRTEQEGQEGRTSPPLASSRCASAPSATTTTSRRASIRSSVSRERQTGPHCSFTLSARAISTSTAPPPRSSISRRNSAKRLHRRQGTHHAGQGRQHDVLAQEEENNAPPKAKKNITGGLLSSSFTLPAQTPAESASTAAASRCRARRRTAARRRRVVGDGQTFARARCAAALRVDSPAHSRAAAPPKRSDTSGSRTAVGSVASSVAF